MSQIIIGYTTEGPTDIRFLSGIILRTFVEVALECRREIEVLEPIIFIDKEKGKSFNEQVKICCREAFATGIMAFCIHVDADDDSDANVFETRIKPAFTEIMASPDEFCKNLVPVIPVQMSESWMLADTQLLKDEIGTTMTDVQLGIDRNPETVADPKQKIIAAIQIARANLTKKRRRNLDISELYQPIGQKISLDRLSEIPSYSKFKDEVRNAYRTLNYLK